MRDYDQQIAMTEEKIRQLQNRKKKLLNQKSIHLDRCVRSAEGFYQRCR